MDSSASKPAPLDHSSDLQDDHLPPDLNQEFEEGGDIILDKNALMEDSSEDVMREEDEESDIVGMDNMINDLGDGQGEMVNPAEYIGVEGGPEERPFKKSFQCGYCSYSTSRQSDLKRHVFSHTGENLFNCTKCEYKTARKSDLRRHHLLHLGEKPFKCGVCHYTTSRKAVLLKHMRIHTANLPRCRVILVQVSKDGQKVINNNALADVPEPAPPKRTRSSPNSGSPSKKKKADLKMYSCDKCDFVAACRKNFHEHKLSHGTEQKWKCPMCGYLTIRKSDMTRHFNIHIDNVFKCNLCEYKTVRHSDFVRHSKVHEKHSYREVQFSGNVE